MSRIAGPCPAKFSLEVIKMKTTFKLILFVIGFVICAMALANPAFAATNEAVDGLGAILLGGSGTITVTSTQLGLVKAVFDSAGTCLASSDSDAACGGTNTVAVLTGMRLTFVIYVDNTTAIVASDVRFTDSIDDVAADYFQFQTQFALAGCAAGEGMAFDATVATGGTKAAIRTAAIAGTCLTNALDGAAQLNEYAGINTGVSPDVLYVGGDAVAPDNDQVDIPANTVWSVAFDVIKLD